MTRLPHDNTVLEQIKENIDIMFEHNDFPDSIVRKVIFMHLDRAAVGKTKYGADLDRKDLSEEDWSQHLIEELMDATLYCLRLKKELEAIRRKARRGW